jgi:hypothetical protein
LRVIASVGGIGCLKQKNGIEAQEGLYRVREPRASYTYDFDAKNSRLSNYRRLILDES